jgi:hypothetical protein
VIGGEQALDALAPGEQPKLTGSARRERRTLRGTNRTLQFRIAAVSQRLGESNDGCRAAVSRVSDLVR